MDGFEIFGIIVLVVVLIIFIPLIRKENREKAEAEANYETSVRNLLDNTGFSATRSAGDLLIDEPKKLFYFPGVVCVFRYDELLQYEVRRGDTITTTNKKAVLGGLLPVVCFSVRQGPLWVHKQPKPNPMLNKCHQS